MRDLPQRGRKHCGAAAILCASAGEWARGPFWFSDPRAELDARSWSSNFFARMQLWFSFWLIYAAFSTIRI
jgi:hypothetical protein